MIRRPPRSNSTDTLFPHPTLFRSYEAAYGAPVADRKGKTSIILLAPIGQCFDEIARHAEALERQLSASWSRQSPVAALGPVLDDPGSTCRAGRCHGHGVLPSIDIDRKSVV